MDAYEFGGVGSFASQYTRVLKNNGWRVVVFAAQGRLSNPASHFPGCEVIIAPKILGWSLVRRIQSGISYRAYLKRVFDAYDIHTVHLFTPWSTYYALSLSAVWRAFRVTTFCGAVHLEMKSISTTSGRLIERIDARMRRWAQRGTLHASQKIIVISTYAKTLMLREFGSSLERKTVYIPGYIEHLPKVIMRPKKKKNHEMYTLVNIGRCEPRKGISMLLQVIDSINKTTRRVKLFVASSVEYYVWYDVMHVYEDLRLFDSVHFLHAVSGAQKRQLFALADAFVMPSLDLETFGMTIIESLSYGIPVIGTSAGSLPEILRRVDSRLVAHGTSSKAMEACIKRFLRLSLEERKKISVRAREVVRRHYSYAALENTIMSVYDERQ